MSETTSNSATRTPKRRVSRKMIALGAVGAVIAAGVATNALSQGAVVKNLRHAGVEAETMVHKVRHGGHRRPKTVEEAQKRASRMAKHLAIELDANGEQMDKLVEIAKGVAGDVFPMRESIKSMREEAVTVLSGETVDRTKLESMRAEQFAKFDEVSKRLTTALADAAEVLNPEQRTKFAERVKEWRGMGGRGRHRGWKHHKRGDGEGRGHRRGDGDHHRRWHD